MSMNISLTPELESMVHAQVKAGYYSSVSEYVREALRDKLFAKHNNAMEEFLVNTVFKETLEQYKAGELETLNDWNALKKMRKDITDQHA